MDREHQCPGRVQEGFVGLPAPEHAGGREVGGIYLECGPRKTPGL